MKKQLIAAIIAGSFSVPSLADSLGLYGGLDLRQTKTSYHKSNDDTANVAGYFAFEHPIPIIPNIKMKYSDLDNDATDSSSSYNGILYYELFDNKTFEFDFGLAYSNIKILGHTEDLGQGYLAAKVHFSPYIHIFGEHVGGSFSDNDAYDTEAGLQYTINPKSHIVNIGIRGGYRYQSLKFDHLPNRQTTEGWFAGVEAHF